MHALQSHLFALNKTPAGALPPLSLPVTLLGGSSRDHYLNSNFLSFFVQDSRYLRPPCCFMLSGKEHRPRWTKRTSFGLLWWLSGKEATCQCRRHRFDPRSRKISCRGAAKPMGRNYWACALEPRSCNY